MEIYFSCLFMFLTLVVSWLIGNNITEYSEIDQYDGSVDEWEGMFE